MSELSKIANELLSKSAKFVNEKNGADTSGQVLLGATPSR